MRQAIPSSLKRSQMWDRPKCLEKKFVNLFAIHLRRAIFFNGKVWKEDALKVQKMVQTLTDKQLEEARLQLQEAQRKEDEAVVSGNKECEQSAKKKIRQARQYRRCTLAYQHTLRISAILKEAQPNLTVDDNYVLQCQQREQISLQQAQIMLIKEIVVIPLVQLSATHCAAMG